MDVLDTPQGKRFWEIAKQDRDFKFTKRDFLKQVSLMYKGALQHTTTPQEIARNLEPLHEKLYRGFFFQDQDVDQNLLLRKANKNTLDKKMPDWARQAAINAPKIRSTPGCKIFHKKFKDVPCVIVTAGPSLQYTIEKLRGIRDRVLIMAVDTSFRGLMKRNIEPHFVNAHDANPNGAKFFQGIDTNTIGVFVNYIHPLTIQSYRGPLVFYYVADESIGQYKLMCWAHEAENRPDGTFHESRIMGGSSVAHTAMYYAMDLGCNPITFVGLDLSYPDLDRSHFETDNPKNLRDKKLIDAQSINGDVVKTDMSFFSYACVFEKMATALAMNSGVKLFNSTTDGSGRPMGIVKSGLQPLHFDEFLNRYAIRERQELKSILEVYRNNG